MSKHKQITNAQLKRKSQKQGKSSLSLEQTEQLQKLEQLSNGVKGPESDSLPTRAGLLNDSGISFTGRQKIATQIGQISGNKYLQRVMLQRQNTSEENDTGRKAIMHTGGQTSSDTTSLMKGKGNLDQAIGSGAIQTNRFPFSDTSVVQRVPAAAPAAMGAAEWIGLGAAGYAVAQDAVKSSAGDISWNMDEMEGVLLPGGGNDVPAYRAKYPNANIRHYRHIVSVWQGFADSRRAGIKLGISFSYDGHAIGNISCDVIDTYDWPAWSAIVNVNFTPLSLARGDISVIRITMTVGADRTLRGGRVRSAILELDAQGILRKIEGLAYVAFGD
jgi:hypothetical protein